MYIMAPEAVGGVGSFAGSSLLALLGFDQVPYLHIKMADDTDFRVIVKFSNCLTL